MPISPDETKTLLGIISAIFGMAAGIFGAGTVLQRINGRVKKAEEAIFDGDGHIIVMTKSDCQKSMSDCITQRLDRRKEDRDNYARELQNIHNALSRQAGETEALRDLMGAMQASMAGMSIRVARELREMGVITKRGN